MTAKEQIEEQVKRASTALAGARESEWEAGVLRGLVGCCERLIQAMTHLQVRVDELEDAQASVKVDVDDLVDAVGYSEQKHEESHR